MEIIKKMETHAINPALHLTITKGGREKETRGGGERED